MKYHDFRLQQYTIGDYGATVTLDLICSYPRQPIEQSSIKFSEVIFCYFIHLGGAIITDIFTTSLKEALSEQKISLAALNQMHGGLPFPEADDDSLISRIESEGFLTWMIESAIGFSGFVVARSIHANETEQGAAANP